ncbi:hypothetical protein BD779DRAFT_1799341 [Infundibulicybe gibba]|nr:hypothetical protein BD779DRAFT_1799341 [Infundibulicybe gibba]
MSRRPPLAERGVGLGPRTSIWIPIYMEAGIANCPTNPPSWTNKKYAVVAIIIFAITVAGIVIGVTADVHHTTVSPSNNQVIRSSLPVLPSPSSASAPAQTTLTATFRSSSWIWLGAILAVEPAGDWVFQKTLPISTAPAKEAAILLTVDDTNANLAKWQNATAVRGNLDPNSNAFAVQAHNSPSDTDASAGSYAGLLASIQISYADGNTTTISSDATWRVTQPIPDGFQSPSFDDAQ